MFKKLYSSTILFFVLFIYPYFFRVLLAYYIEKCGLGKRSSSFFLNSIKNMALYF
jgi:hypothetical protein